MLTNSEGTAPLPPKGKARRYLFALVVSGTAVYFLLPRFAAMGQAFEVISNLKVFFVALSIGAQLLSYLGSGYLLRTVVKLAAKPLSILEAALMTAGANSVGTLGGGVLGTAGITYLWLSPRRERRSRRSWRLAAHFLEQHCASRSVAGWAHRNHPSEKIYHPARCRLRPCVLDPRGCSDGCHIVPSLSRKTSSYCDRSCWISREGPPQTSRACQD